LTTTAYKYLDIGINVEPVSHVDIIFGDNRGNQIPLSRKTWTTIIEKHTNIEQFLQSTSASSIRIHDLLVELVKISNENIVKFILNNKCMYEKLSTVLFLLEHCIENVFLVVAGSTCCE